ncbi:hypothetical protein Trydic_g3242 [Trypoxylus dichotomus]
MHVICGRDIKFMMTPMLGPGDHIRFLNWGAHVHRVLDCGRQMSRTLYPLLIWRGKQEPSRKIQMYKTVVRPIVTYVRIGRMGNCCDLPYQQTPGVPEPDTVDCL